MKQRGDSKKKAIKSLQEGRIWLNCYVNYENFTLQSIGTDKIYKLIMIKFKFYLYQNINPNQ